MSTAQEALHVHARATVSVDLHTLFSGMTPEGFASAMELGNTTWKVTSYELTGQSVEGEDRVFDVRYETDLGPMALRYRLREVAGEWKVVNVARLDAEPQT